MSTYRRGALTLMGGTAFGQALGVLLIPVLARVYSPAEFGVYTVVMALAAPLTVIATLRFELAVPLPRRDSHAYALVAAGSVSTLFVILLSLVVALAAPDAISSALSKPELASALWLVPLIAGSMALYVLLGQLALREMRFSALAGRNAVQSTSTLLLQVLAGMSAHSSLGLPAGVAGGQAIGLLALLRGAGLRSASAQWGVRPRVIRYVARRYRRFPLYLTVSGLMNVLGLQIPVLLIAAANSAAVAGWLGMAQRVLAFPVMLIGAALGQVYLASAARTTREGTGLVSPLLLATAKRLAVVAVAIGVPVMAFGPWMFATVLGENWRTSGAYGQALAVGLIMQLVAVPISTTLAILERQRLQFAWDGLRLIIVSGAVYLSIRVGASPENVMWVLGGALAITYGTSIQLSFRVAKQADRRNATVNE